MEWVGGASAYLPSSDCLNAVGFTVTLVGLCVFAVLDFRHQRRCTRANQQLDESSLPVIPLETLSWHDGVATQPVYCCLRGRIYDVSSSHNFSPGGSYSFLAGADATVGMAKMSLDRKHLNSIAFRLLTDAEWYCVDGWVRYMDAKYTCVARLKEFEDYEANIC